MTIAEQILEALKQNSSLSTKDLVTALSVSPRTINHNIANLIADGKVSKTGKHPEIKYCLATTGQTSSPPNTQDKGGQLNSTVPISSIKTVGDDTFGVSLCKRLGLDPLTVQARHDKIHDWVLGGYTLKSKRATSKPPNLMLRLVGGIYELVVWALALLAVFVGKMIKPKAKPLAEEGNAAKAKTNPFVWITAITFLTGGVIGGIIVSSMHGAPKKRVSSYKTKEEIVLTEDQVNDLQQRIDQVDNQNRDLQDQLTQTKEQLQVETRHASSLQDELNMTKDQSARDQAEIERLNGVIESSVSSRGGEAAVAISTRTTNPNEIASSVASLPPRNDTTEDKGGQLNSTVPISNDAPELEHIPIDQVIAWTSQGVSSDEIINRIKASHSTYRLIASDLAWLRQQGVNEEVIKAMQDTKVGSHLMGSH